MQIKRSVLDKIKDVDLFEFYIYKAHPTSAIPPSNIYYFIFKDPLTNCFYHGTYDEGSSDNSVIMLYPVLIKEECINYVRKTFYNEFGKELYSTNFFV